MKRKFAIVVPDAGPLITLGCIDSLDLLDRIDAEIYVVDQVIEEVTRKPSAPGAAQLRTFIKRSTRLHVFQTAVGENAKLAREMGRGTRERGLGEAAIAEFLARLDEVIPQNETAVLLYEDSDVAKMRVFRSANATIVSTYSFLLALEKRGIIPSAEGVWKKVLTVGRVPSKKQRVEPLSPSAAGADFEFTPK